MASTLIAFVEDMDRCWLERRFDDLAGYIADDVVMVAPGAGPRLEGIEVAIASYRDFMRRCSVTRFLTSGHVVTERGPVAVTEYDWEMAWHEGGADHAATGREVLALVQREQGWRVVWRMQVPA